MLRYAVLIAGFEQAADDVYIISICPYLGGGYILDEAIPWPEHFMRGVPSRIFIIIFVSACRYRRFGTKEFLEDVSSARCRIFCVLLRLTLLPCRLRVAP